MKLGLVIDLDTCVGCHACAVACKQWNTSGTTGPLSDYEPYGKEPTGASYKREEDGIVLVDQSKCMGCNLCAWACPYGARELDQEQGVMKKCTLCVDRIYDVNLPKEDRKPACVLTWPTSARFFGDFDDPNSEVSTLVRERGGYAMMPEVGYNPVNKYLPPRERPAAPVAEKSSDASTGDSKSNTQSLLGKWLQKQKSAFDSLGER